MVIGVASRVWGGGGGTRVDGMGWRQMWGLRKWGTAHLVEVGDEELGRGGGGGGMAGVDRWEGRQMRGGDRKLDNVAHLVAVGGEEWGWGGGGG